MFLFKKLLGLLLMPVPVSLLLLVLGLLALVRGRRRWSWLLLCAGLLVQLLASNRAVSSLLCGALESRHPPAPLVLEAGSSVPLAACTVVAVLGSGHGDAPGLPSGQRLSPSARARLVEGLRIARLLPDARLIVSGSAIGDEPRTHARVVADAAVELGFPRERILEIDTARDTAEETAAIARLVGPQRVAFVTSAWHMPRAMRLARLAGLDAVPCPSDYLDRNNHDDLPLLAWFTWDSDSLVNTTRSWRECLGLAWTSLVGHPGE